LQEDCNGAGPILPVPKTKKLAFLGLGYSVSYRPVWPSENVMLKKKEFKMEPGAPPNSARKMGYAVNGAMMNFTGLFLLP
jgi:hypothetical protein